MVVVLVAKSCLTLATPQTVARQAPLSMGFSRQEYWSGIAVCTRQKININKQINIAACAKKEVKMKMIKNDNKNDFIKRHNKEDANPWNHQQTFLTPVLLLLLV